MTRITPRHKQKPLRSVRDIIDLISEDVGALLGNEKAQRNSQRKDEYRFAREYFEGNHRRMKGKL